MNLNLMQFQLFLIRILLGIDFLPYAVSHLFTSVYKTPMTYFVGICTLLAGLGLVFGFLTRLTAVLSAIFLWVALFVGHHQAIGFFWYQVGGGWEFLALWGFLCLSYVLNGGGKISIDYLLKRYCIDSFNINC